MHPLVPQGRCHRREHGDAIDQPRTPLLRVFAHRLRTWLRTVDTATFILHRRCRRRMALTQDAQHMLFRRREAVAARKKPSISDSHTDARANTSAARAGARRPSLAGE